MSYICEDSIKTRLTDRAHLVAAVKKLMARGVPEELIPVRLTRVFYVDMDELNAVLHMVRINHLGGAATQMREFHAVA